jgi:hypothetical protein
MQLLSCLDPGGRDTQAGKYQHVLPLIIHQGDTQVQLLPSSYRSASWDTYSPSPLAPHHSLARGQLQGLILFLLFFSPGTRHRSHNAAPRSSPARSPGISLPGRSPQAGHRSSSVPLRGEQAPAPEWRLTSPDAPPSAITGPHYHACLGRSHQDSPPQYPHHFHAFTRHRQRNRYLPGCSLRCQEYLSPLPILRIAQD